MEIWDYGQIINIIAIRQKLSEQDLPRENFNINILHRDEKGLDEAYNQFLKSIGKADGFKILDQGDKIINTRKYKYLIETHKNSINKEDMNNYVLFTNNNGEIFILTMVTTTENFEKYKGLFDVITLSLYY